MYACSYKARCLASLPSLPLIVPGEADRNDLDFVYVLPELKSFRDGDRFSCNLGGGWLLELHIYIDGTSSRRSRNNGEIKMRQKFLGRSSLSSLRGLAVGNRRLLGHYILIENR